MTTSSMNGCLYYIIFIDDFSRKTWTFFWKLRMNISTNFRILRILLRIRQVDTSVFS
jgi:hypothetical protein